MKKKLFYWITKRWKLTNGQAYKLAHWFWNDKTILRVDDINIHWLWFR